MNLSIFQDARFQPTPDQADQARIADSMFDKSEDPIVIEAPKEVLQIPYGQKIKSARKPGSYLLPV